MHAPVITYVVRTVVGSTLRRPWPLFVAVCWCVASAAAAQSALTGIVHDPSGRVAVGATVTVIDPAGNQQWETHVSPIGYYEIELPPGKYQVQATLDDLSFFGTVRVFPNEKTALDIDLQATTTDKVTVESTAYTADAFGPSAALGARFSREDIETTPLSNGRTVQSLAVLVPGIVVTDSNGNQAQFTAAGQRRFTNRITIDGVSADLAIDIGNPGITEAATGTLPAMSALGSTQTIVPMSAVEGMEIKTTATSPQDARAPGAQTMIVTRAGNDRFTGDAFTDFRPESLGATDWFARLVDSQKTTQRGPASSFTGGASAGGPVLPQRLFYFGAWERQRVTRPVAATVQVPSVASREAAPDAIRPLFEAFPVPNGPETTQGLAELSGDIAAVSTLSSLSLRLDANLSANHRLFSRFNIGRSSGDWLDTTQVPTPLFGFLESTKTKTATIGLSSALSSSMTNELRASVSTNGGWLSAGRSSHVASGEFPLDVLLPANPPEGALSPNTDTWVSMGVTSFNGTLTSGGQTGNTQEQLQLVDTLSLTRGRHDLRIGVDGRWLTSATNPPRESYTYRFSNLSNLQLGRALLNVTDSSPARVRFTRVAAFAEDTFRVSTHLSLAYGVRYTVEPTPANLSGTVPLILDASALPLAQARPADAPLWKTAWGNIAPRVSATYQFGTATGHETTFRGGWNLIFDELAGASANVFGSVYPALSKRALNAALPAPADLLDAPVPPLFSAGDRNSYFATTGDVRTPKTYSWQVGVDQALGRSQRLGVAYAGSAGRDLFYWYGYNLPQAPIAQVAGFSNDGRADYHALLAEYVWRLTHGLQAQVSYTWSHAIDLDSGETHGIITPNPPPSLISPLQSRGSADFDRRHVLQAVVSYQLPRPAGPELLGTLASDWQVDAVVAARSGAPFTVTATRNIDFGIYAFRADAVSGVPVWISDPTAPGGQSLNPAAFMNPADLIPKETRQGTFGRNTLLASPLRQIDLGLSRVFRLGDRVTAKLRLDAFNVFNVANFGQPVAELNEKQFGQPFQSYANALGTGTLSGGGLVPLQQVGGPRSVQIGIRLAF